MAIDPRIFENPAFPSGPGLDVVGGLGQFAATLLPILNLLMQQQQFGQAQQGVVSQPFDPNRDYYSEIVQAVNTERARLAQTDPSRLQYYNHPVTGQPVSELSREDWVNVASQVTGLDPRVLDLAYTRLRDIAPSGRFGADQAQVARLFNQTLGEAARTAIPSLERQRFEQTLAEQQRQFNEQLALQRQAQQLAEQQAQADLALRLAQTQAQMAADPFARLSFQLGLTGGQAVSDPVRVAEIFLNRLQSGQLGPPPGNAAPGLPGVFVPQSALQPGQVAPGTGQPQPLPSGGTVTTQVGPMIPAPSTGGPFAQTTSSPTERLQALYQNVTPRSIAAGFGQATPSQRTAALSLFRQAGRDAEDAMQEIQAFTPTRQGSTQTFFNF